MDKAEIGRMRIGNFRIGVTKPIFDNVVDKLEKTSSHSRGGMDAALVGYCRVGYCRVGVYVPVFDELIGKVEKV